MEMDVFKIKSGGSSAGTFWIAALRGKSNKSKMHCLDTSSQAEHRVPEVLRPQVRPLNQRAFALTASNGHLIANRRTSDHLTS